MNQLLDLLGIENNPHSWMDNLATIAIIIAISLIVNFICNKIILRLFSRIAQRTETILDDLIIERRVIHKLINIVPAILIYVLIPTAFPNEAEFGVLDFIQRICLVYIVAISLRFINASLDLIPEMSARKENMKNKPLKGFVQILQIIFIVIAGVFIIAILVDKPPTILFTGLGASAAILTLVFKDTIVGFTAGIQLSTNNMLHPGDWIQVPKYGADGIVVEITLYAVRVRNWDNTITTVPPAALINDSFQNWRPMFESKGRRIKRSVYIDMNSVKFCTPEMLEKFRKIDLITDYVSDKEQELINHNTQLCVDSSVIVNGRHQTNLGIFRAYLLRYLKSNPAISDELICMVRHLQPTEIGIPVELYCFSSDRAWVNYEGVQADIIDHVLAIVPEFDLRVFQNISGYDISRIK